MESIHLPVAPTVLDTSTEAHLVCHNDPFNPNDTTILVVPTGAWCSEILKDFSYDQEFYDLVVSRNQEIIDCDFVVEEHDTVSFLVVPKGGGGGGKQILMLVAVVALAVLAGPAAAGLVGLMSTGGMAYSAAGLMMTSILQVGITMVGAMLISSLFKPSTPSTPSLQSFEQSTTYGWNTSGNAIGQGANIPILYGTTRITPQYIGKYLDIISDSQYLRILLALGEGPFDTISGIEINDTDMSLFRDVQIDTRLGTNDQTVMEYFNDTWVDQGVNKKLIDSETWVYAQTLGDTVSSINIGIVCPQGIYYANDQGGMDEYSVTIDMEYRRIGTDIWYNIPSADVTQNATVFYVDHNPRTETRYTVLGGSYTAHVADMEGPYDVWVGGTYYKTATGSHSTEAAYIETIALLPIGVTGQAEFPKATTRWVSDRYYSWTALSHTMGPAFFTISDSKPAAVRRSFRLVGLDPAAYEIRARFHDTPNTSSRYGSSTYFEFLQEAIADDFAYPNTALLGVNILATDQISGNLPKITCVASRVTGTYGRLDNPAWACLDLLMNTRYGAGIPLNRIDFQSFQDWADYCTAQSFTINLYLDQTLTLSQGLQLIGQLGRGTVIQYGSSFSALVDKPDILPTQGFLFSMGNIIQDSFSEAFLPLKDRANIIEVTYYDYTNNYDRTAIEVSQGNYDLTHTVNKTSINLLGCIDRTQALRQAKYHLNQNRYLTIMATWEASIDAIACKVGDIVNVAHDVPQWGYSGRILSNTINTITIDRADLFMEDNKTYYIQVSNIDTDEQIYVPITSISGNTLSTPSVLPILGEYSVYSFGEINRHAKKMRILSISTAGDLKRKITALEYNENVYNDTVQVPTPVQIQDLSTKDLVVSEYMKTTLSGSIETIVQLSWKGAKLSYEVSYRRTVDAVYTLAGEARGTTYEIHGLLEGVLYDFLVDGVYYQYKVLGKTTPPPPPTNIRGSEYSNTFTLEWDYPYRPVDFDRFDIIHGFTTLGSTRDTNFTVQVTTTKAITFVIQAYDTSGNVAADLITVQVQGIGQVVNLRSYYTDGYTKLIWDRVVDNRNPIGYEIRYGAVWETSLILGVTYNLEYILPYDGMYLIKAVYAYPDGTYIYSAVVSQIVVEGAILPKNILVSYDEKATGWLGTKTNLIINGLGNLEINSLGVDTSTNIDAEFIFDYAGGIAPMGIYEIPIEHIVDVGEPQMCRIWLEYSVEGKVILDMVDAIPIFDDWGNIDGLGTQYLVKPQLSIAQADGIFGAWEDFTIGEYVGSKFKMRLVLYSLSYDTTCIVNSAIFFVDMPDKIQSNTIQVGISGSTIVYPKAFQVRPNLQITITGAVAGDDAILSNETSTGFDIIIYNNGSPVVRDINWLAKGY